MVSAKNKERIKKALKVAGITAAVAASVGGMAYGHYKGGQYKREKQAHQETKKRGYETHKELHRVIGKADDAEKNYKRDKEKTEKELGRYKHYYNVRKGVDDLESTMKMKKEVLRAAGEELDPEEAAMYKKLKRAARESRLN